MGKVVCVTGASGFIASWLVKLLLHRGYTVHATVRNLGDPTKVEHLKELEGAKERLRLFEADLVKEGSFDAAIEGCDGVFHVASPVTLHYDNIKDPQEEIIKPAVNGTLNILQSCLKVPSIKRVVITSSLAAVFGSERVANDGIIDETWYSDPAFCEKIKEWYTLSKTLAEQEAWKFSKKHGIDLVIMHPGLVIGRCLQLTAHFTLEDFIALIKEGKCKTLPYGFAPVVCVKDVALAHILAFENPSAKGRYLLAATTMSISQVFDILRNLYPNIILPKVDEDGINMMHRCPISKEKAESLGIKYTPVEEGLKETIELLKERNLISLE